jgi:hypothetical protein
MSWQEDLMKKEKEFNLQKEVENVHIRNNSGNNSRNNSRRSSDVYISGSNRKTLNNVTEKGGKGMITVDGALKDLEVIEKEAGDTGAKAIVKALKVVVKFLSTMRSNQLLTDDEKINIRKVKEARVAKEVK